MTGGGRARRRLCLAAVASSLPLLTGCVSAAAASPPRPGSPSRLAESVSHREARAWLRAKRAEAPREPSGWNVTARFVDERTGLAQSGRGALAVRPPDALRLQLVGPAGKLALDVWLGPAGGRLSSPALDLVERTAPGEHRAGRPTGFLAWWMLHRFDGRLLAVERAGDEERLIVRAAAGELVTIVHAGAGADERIHITRRTALDEEQITHAGGFCGHSQYRSSRARIAVDVRCGVATPPPRLEAFDDPDGTR